MYYFPETRVENVVSTVDDHLIKSYVMPSPTLFLLWINTTERWGEVLCRTTVHSDINEFSYKIARITLRPHNTEIFLGKFTFSLLF